jgi:parallel beta-helix repeat protein
MGFRKYLFIIFIICFIVLFCFNSLAITKQINILEMQNIYGDGINDDSAGIEQALNSNLSRDYYFPDGVYLCKNIDINVSNIRLFGSPGAIIKTIDTATINDSIFRITDKNNIILESINIDGNAENTPGSHLAGISLIRLVNCSNVKIKNCRLYNNDYLAISLCDGTNDVEVTGCTIKNTDVGVLTQGIGCYDINVHHNYFNGGTSEAVSFWASANSFDERVFASHNIIKNKVSGVQVRNTNNFHIDSNIISNCITGITLFNSASKDGMISYNTISFCNSGITGNCDNVIINENRIMDMNFTGIWIKDTYRAQIKNNIISNVNIFLNDSSCIRLEKGVNCMIYGNILFDTRVPKLNYAGIQLNGKNLCSSNIIRDNFGDLGDENRILIEQEVFGTKLSHNFMIVLNLGNSTIIE